MTPTMWIIVIGLQLAFLTYVAYKGEWLTPLAVVCIFVFGVVSCNRSDWYQASAAADQKARYDEAVANQKPRFVSEADGCKVYTFKGGDRWQYFTRCQATTTTTNTFREGCGKNCSRTVEQNIPTENKP